jgi:methionyl-tRNA formyltransferase
MNKLKVVYCSTPDIGIPCLELLAQHTKIELVKVLSMPDREAGRGQKLRSPAIVDFCRSHKLPFFQTPNLNHESVLLEDLKKTEVDIIIVFAFAQFLKQPWLDLPTLGCFNIHTSLLPLYRGAAPIQYALLNGDRETGVSIQKMVLKMDAGDIAYLKQTSIFDHDNTLSLTSRLKFLAPLALDDFLDQVLNDQLKYIAQDESKVSYAPTIKKEETLIDLKSLSCKTFINKVRAYGPRPGAHFFVDGKRLKILEAVKSNHPASPGKLENVHGQLILGCLDGSLRLTQVQMEGKKVSSDSVFLNGHRGPLEI